VELLDQFPDLTFISGDYFMWSPAEVAVMYDEERLSTNNGKLALLHEIGHAKLGHKMYKYDIELLTIESEAWDFVRSVANLYDVFLDEEHIASCIDSYDHWLSKRATCPTCDTFSLQRGRDHFSCFLCGAEWQVNWRKDRRVKRTIIPNTNSTN
jgi:hypothetical protein